MSYYAVKELSFDLPAASVARSAGGFTEANQNEVIGRWVQRDTGNTVILAADNARLLGVITRVTGGKVAVAVGPVLRGKRSADAPLAAGVGVVGATRQESATGTAERGFCKAAALTVDAGRGYTLGNGTAVSTNAPAGYEDVLMLG